MGALRHRAGTTGSPATSRRRDARGQQPEVPDHPWPLDLPGPGVRRDLREQCDQLHSQLIERQFGHTRPGTDQIPTRRWFDPRRQQRPEPATHPVAGHGRSDGATDGEGQARWFRSGVGQVGAPQRRRTDPGALTCEASERVALADPPDQADRRARPLARRAFKMARPERVLIRARKPCLRARRRVFG